MAEISAINNFKKYNSGSGRGSINNVVREAFRELEKFKNNVNQELTQFNKILVMSLNGSIMIQKLTAGAGMW